MKIDKFDINCISMIGAPMSNAPPMSTGPQGQGYGNQPISSNQQQPMNNQANYNRPMGQQGNMMQQGTLLC